jgi:glycosyltransferase involved in cell wall biosynthesis
MSNGGKIMRYALIPTHNRPEQLTALVQSLVDQCHIIVVIDNASDPPVSEVELRASVTHGTVIVIRDDEQPPNLSRLWNVGFDTIAASEQAFGSVAWSIAVLNDDSVVPFGWYDYVVSHMRDSNAAIACTDAYAKLTDSVLKTEPDGDITTRMCPWAFVVRGELELRADETFRWWWGDTDLDWTARGRGGVLLLPGYTTQNTGANSTTHGELAEQAGRDGVAFAAKWGWRPW